MNNILSKDLENKSVISNFYYHENSSKPILDLYRILIYKIISVSDKLAKVEIYDRNGIRFDNLQRTDFKFEGNNKIVNLENCLKDIRASDSFKIRRFSYR